MLRVPIYAAVHAIYLGPEEAGYRVVESFAPIAACDYGGGDLPRGVVEPCPLPVAIVLAPAGWRVGACRMRLECPARGWTWLTPSQAVLLGLRRLDGFRLETPPKDDVPQTRVSETFALAP